MKAEASSGAERPGIRYKLSRAFLLQAGLIGLTAVLSVLAARFTLEEVMVKQALRDEADYFWSLGAGVNPPDTRNLTGYLADLGDPAGLPVPLQGLAPGFHPFSESDGFTMVHVSEREGRRLYLVFDGEQVGDLAFYFGVVPLAMVLVVLYLVTWTVYRLSSQAVSPVIHLAHAVASLDPTAPDPGVFDQHELPAEAGSEVQALSRALAEFASRINAFVERERNLTRDTSHELRSPLTVIRIAADMLLSEQELSPPARNSVLRIKRNAADMEELTEAFLLLARESEQGLAVEPVSVNAIIADELDRVKLMFRDKPLSISVNADVQLWVESTEKVLSVLVGNLLRNACAYTDEGSVEVRILPQGIVIEDSGVGLSEDQLNQVFKPFFRADGARRRGGHGVGLTIVKRFCERFGWQINIHSQPGSGTRVSVAFPGARVESLAER